MRQCPCEDSIMTRRSLIVRPRINDRARFRLFVFHHAGGNAAYYLPWLSTFPETFLQECELCFCEHPGRGRSLGSPLCDDMQEIVGMFANDVRALSDRPYGFFGHSMGGQVAFALAQELLSRRERTPAWLGISSRHAPRAMVTRYLRADLSRQELVARIRNLGGTPQAVMESEELLDLLVDIFVADLRICDTWAPRPEWRPLEIPISIFAGRGDEHVPLHSLDPWQWETNVGLDWHLFEGGHFYFSDDSPVFLKELENTVRACLSPAAGSSLA